MPRQRTPPRRRKAFSDLTRLRWRVQASDSGGVVFYFTDQDFPKRLIAIKLAVPGAEAFIRAIQDALRDQP